MPSTTEPQARFMAACAHGAGYESCPPAKVSKEFNQADKGSAMLSRAMKGRKKYQIGGMAAAAPAIGAAGTTLNQPPQGQAAPNLASMLGSLRNATQAPGASMTGIFAPPGGGAGNMGPGSFGYADPNQPPPTGIPPSLWSQLIQQNNNMPPSMRGGMSGPVWQPPAGGAPPQAPNLGGGLGALTPRPPMPTPPASAPPAGPMPGMFGMPGGMMGGVGPAPGARPPMPPPGMGGLGQMAAFLGSQGPRPTPAPAMRPPVGHPGMMRPMPFQGMRGAMMARGGQPPIPGAMPTMPGQMPGQMMRPPSPLQSLISGPMAGRHAGFPGPRKPRIPLPGSLRNINQMINRSKERLGSFPV